MDEKNNEQTELLRLIWVEMKALGANLGGRIDTLNADLSGRIDATNARIDGLNAELSGRIDATNARLGTVETVLRDLAGQRVILGRFVRSVVDIQIADLRDRLARVEAKLAG